MSKSLLFLMCAIIAISITLFIYHYYSKRKIEHFTKRNHELVQGKWAFHRMKTGAQIVPIQGKDLDLYAYISKQNVKIVNYLKNVVSGSNEMGFNVNYTLSGNIATLFDRQHKDKYAFHLSDNVLTVKLISPSKNIGLTTIWKRVH